MKVELSKYIKPETVCIYTENVTKPFILKKISEICESVINDPSVSASMIYQYLQNREFLGSTGLQDGVALPHCRMPLLKEFIAGLLVSPEGVAFGSLDGKLSRLFFFIIAPEDKDSEFLNIMAEVGQFLSKKETIDKLLLAKTNSELYSTLILLLENYSFHSE